MQHFKTLLLPLPFLPSGLSFFPPASLSFRCSPLIIFFLFLFSTTKLYLQLLFAYLLLSPNEVALCSLEDGT